VPDKGLIMFQYRQVGFDQMGWRGRIGLVVGIALALALAIALVILSLGLALILLPIVAIGLLIGRWRFNKLMAERRAPGEWSPGDQPPGAGRTIAIEYSAVDDRDGR
jgi:hypothetical protein